MDDTLQNQLARDYLDAMMAEYVLSAGGAAKTADVARVVGDRVGASARLVRNELAHSPRLTLVERRWDLRVRHEGRQRSVDGAMRHVLEQHGKPVTRSQLAQELSLVRNQSKATLARAVERLVETREDYVLLDGDRVVLREWLLDLQTDDDDEAVRRHNFFGVKVDLDEALGVLDLDATAAADDELDALVALVNSVDEPVGSRVAMYALWRARRTPFEASELFAEALDDDRVVLLPGPAWATPRLIDSINGAIQEMSVQYDAEMAAAEPPTLEEILEGEELELEEFTLSPEDLAELQRIIQESGDAVPLPNLVSDVFELFPGDLQYASAVRAVFNALRSDDRFVELPGHRYHLRVLLPPTLYRVPVTLQLSPIVVTNLTDERVDAPLRDEGLEGGLEWEVRAPDLEDIGEEQEVHAIAAGIALARRQRFVTSYRHFVSGTIKVRKIDRGVFPDEPAMRPLTLVDSASDDSFHVWLNNDTGLLCGLDEWYKGRLQPTGHVFYLERDEERDVWRADVDEEPDPMLFIPPPLLDELLVLRVRAEHSQDVSVLEIMRQLMEKHPGGVSFRRLYTECNIVRRVAKRLIASNLSAYPMFTLSDDETLWLYDERKANRPMKPEKKPFIVADPATEE